MLRSFSLSILQSRFLHLSILETKTGYGLNNRRLASILVWPVGLFICSRMFLL